MYELVKRTFDLTASSVGLILTAPVLLVAAVGIGISDPGPVFYKAKRIGYRGEEFCMYKFRSMRVPSKKSEESEASFKADTARIFPFGELIRKTKIDELPQLINIVKGDMSIVGPRPASVDQVSVMREGKYAVANDVKPGLTGPAAIYDYVYGDTVADPEAYERLVLPIRKELEAYYPAHMSAAYDMKMIWYTVVCIFATVFKKEPKRILNELTGCVSVGGEAEVHKECV